jgi:hypothetical protein
MADQINLNQLLGGTNVLGLLDPSGALQAEAERRAQAAGLLNFAFGALQASRGQPGQGRPGLGQIIGQAGPVGVAGYQQSFEKTLGDIGNALKIQSAIAEMKTPKYERLKTPAGGELLLQIPRGGGTPQLVPLAGLPTTKPPEFDAQTQAFIDLRFGKPFSELSQDQKTQVLQFSNAPNAEKETALKIEAEKQSFETGVRVPLPPGRAQMIAPPPIAPAAPQVAPVKPPAAPQAKPTAGPTPQEVTADAVKVSRNIQLSANVAGQPLKPNEVPLIQSTGITPKQKTILESERPQVFTATEFGLNQIRQTRNTIRELLADKNFDSAFGFGGETLSKIPGSGAADVLAKLDALKNQQFARSITAMRDASKTGAAVGNVTEQEGRRFENMQGSLGQFQSAKQARETLQRMEKELLDAENRLSNSYGRYYGPGQFSVIDLYTAPAKTKSLQDIFFPGRK